MSINLPPSHGINQGFVDDKGNLSDGAFRFLMQLSEELRKNFNPTGYTFPSQTQENVNALNTGKNNGKVLYNSETQSMQLNNSGEFEDIYTRPKELTTSEISAIPANKINGTWVVNKDNGNLLYGINGAFRQVSYT